MISSIAAARGSSAEVVGRTDTLGVTVLTGFLGAGKTTVLRHLLAGDHGLRIAVVVNDVGALAVDDRLVSAMAADRVELSNGCACCALVDDLAETLESLVREGGYEAVVVEATGVADAAALAQTALGTPGCRLDGVVAVVDGAGFTNQLADRRVSHLLRRQLETAHVVLVSRADLMSDDELAAVVARVVEVAPGRMVLPTLAGAVDPAVVLGAAVRGPSFAPTPDGHQLEVASDVTTFDGWTAQAVGEWCERTGAVVVRAKGWFRDVQGELLELQSVAGRWTITPATHPVDTGVVVITLPPAS